MQVGDRRGPRADLAKASTPLNDLALRYASPRLAIALDLAAAVSCFSGVIGGLAAAGRILFALGRAGLSPALGEVHPMHRQPCAAVSVAGTNHYQIEMLANLDQVPEASALVMVSFPKPEHGSGFPARVVAILP